MALQKENNKPIGNSIEDLSVDFITIMEDSLRVILIKHVNKIGKNRDLISPIALFVSLIIVLITASNFRHFLVPPDAWFGIFLVATIVAGCYLIYVIRNRSKKSDDVEDIIIEVKQAKGGALTGLRVATPIKQIGVPQASPSEQSSSLQNNKNLLVFQKKKKKGKNRKR